MIILIRISKHQSTTNMHIRHSIHIHHFKTTFMCARSIAGVPSGRRFRATQLLRTTCMRSL